MGVKNLVKKILVAQQNRRYDCLLRKRRGSYPQWITEYERIAEEAVAMGDKEPVEYVYFYYPGGRVTDKLKQILSSYFATHPEVLICYGDEDVWEEPPQDRKMPWFKPEASLETLEHYFYLGSLIGMRKEACANPKGVVENAHGDGGFLVEDAGAFQEWIYQSLMALGGCQQGSVVLGHVPYVLYHCESRERIEAFIKESRGEVSPLPPTRLPLISIIIPSKDHPQLLEACLEGIQRAAEGTAYEAIVVDNGSSPENRARIEKLLQQYRQRGITIEYLYSPMEFHFSKMCNMGVEQARGELILLLNDDVTLCAGDTLRRMGAMANRSAVGAVGLKLYYPDSIRIQHAGITNLPMGPVHKLQFLKDDRDYYFGYNRGIRNVLAVTGACLMVRKDRYLEAGGLCGELKVAFNDVDFCFQLYELGYRNLCMNDRYAYHHESLSRGEDESVEKLNRLLTELELLNERHPALKGTDPYYPFGLNREGLDTRIRPAYETAGNCVQLHGELQQGLNLQEYRQDNCVLFRVESIQNSVVQGYCVVLGDNSACYDKVLFLHSQEGTPIGIALEEQYRPDLAENMPEQRYVALCGYAVKLDAFPLPLGDYRIGVCVRNRVTGLRLMNLSNRFYEVTDP